MDFKKGFKIEGVRSEQNGGDQKDHFWKPTAKQVILASTLVTIALGAIGAIAGLGHQYQVLKDSVATTQKNVLKIEAHQEQIDTLKNVIEAESKQTEIILEHILKKLDETNADLIMKQAREAKKVHKTNANEKRPELPD